jgi:hypothetical protein
MEAAGPSLNFPTNFCCNCGGLDCVNEVQDTRVTRYFGIGGTETTFHLAVPICANCRRSTRRRPSGFFSKLLVLGLSICVVFLGLIALGAAVELPLWFSENLFGIGAGLGFVGTILFYWLRRARPPQTSFYQPVRVKAADLKYTDIMSGESRLVYIKLAFTNPDYLTAFRNANQEAITAGHLAVVKA